MQCPCRIAWVDICLSCSKSRALMCWAQVLRSGSCRSIRAHSRLPAAWQHSARGLTCMQPLHCGCASETSTGSGQGLLLSWPPELQAAMCSGAQTASACNGQGDAGPL